jgi:hypothetical protein
MATCAIAWRRRLKSRKSVQSVSPEAIIRYFSP